MRHSTRRVMVSKVEAVFFGFLAAVAISSWGCGPSSSSPPPSAPSAAPAPAAAPTAISIFDQSGKFNVAVPETGFGWKKFQDIPSGSQPISVYVCTKPGDPKAAILTVFPHKSMTDADRRNFTAGQYDGFRQSQEQNKGKILEGERPVLGFNIPDIVSFALKAQNADGSVFCCYTTIIFGEVTVSVMGRAPEAGEAKAFCEKVVESLKKPGQ